jgi:hypothetical protein
MEEKGVFEGFQMFGGFDTTMIESLLRFMRFSFDVAFDNVIKVQDFNLKLLKDMLEKSKDVQADTVQTVFDLIDNARKVRDEYKKMMAISESPKAITYRFLRLLGFSAGSMECKIWTCNCAR